jgi:uncharacterized protein (TIGR03086 family)
MSDENPIALFDRAAAAAQTVISGVRPDQLDLPTPCSDWSVRQLLNHLVSGTALFHSLATGGGPVDRSADHLGTDPAGAFRTSVASLREVFAADGGLTQLVTSPFGEQPAAVLLEMRVNEMMLHGWDVAKATGQPTDLDPGVAEHCLASFRALRASGRGATMFAEPTEAPAGASMVDQLAALSGRKAD